MVYESETIHNKEKLRDCVIYFIGITLVSGILFIFLFVDDLWGVSTL